MPFPRCNQIECSHCRPELEKLTQEERDAGMIPPIMDGGSSECQENIYKNIPTDEELDRILKKYLKGINK